MKNLFLGTLMMVGVSFFPLPLLAASAILLEGGEIKPAAVLRLSLDPLLKNVQYTLSCQVSNHNATPVDLGFAFDLKEGGISADFSLNNTVLENGQASVKQGENTLEVMVSSAQPGSSVIIRNLDFKQPVEVNNCVASPTLRTLEAKGRFIVATNDSDKAVNLTVANSEHLLYTLAPHSRRYIFLSKASQQLSIQNVKD